MKDAYACDTTKRVLFKGLPHFSDSFILRALKTKPRLHKRAISAAISMFLLCLLALEPASKL